MPYVPVARVDEVPPRTAHRVVVEGTPIAICNLGDGLHAVADTCTHAEASLCDGGLQGDELLCPLHFARFDVRTGEAVAPPAEEPLRTFPVRVNGASIEVEV